MMSRVLAGACLLALLLGLPASASADADNFIPNSVKQIYEGWAFASTDAQKGIDLVIVGVNFGDEISDTGCAAASRGFGGYTAGPGAEGHSLTFANCGTGERRWEPKTLLPGLRYHGAVYQTYSTSGEHAGARADTGLFYW